MQRVITSFLPFPPIAWWQVVIQASSLCLDRAEHYEKMSYRNKYYIATANGKLGLSIPLEGGRNQRIAINKVHISDREKWQQQHWRTITSAYKRSPYFEFYEPTLSVLFEKKYQNLVDFSLDSIKWVMGQMQLTTEILFIDSFQKNYPDDIDLRHALKPSQEDLNGDLPLYQQVFQEHIGFLPNLSVLDLLFSEGPYALRLLKRNKL
jgi:hypothetical protein